MKCPRCQYENPVDTSFCGGCGARLAASCSACGSTNPPTNKFCGKCGAPLTADPPAGRFASPESYTPKHLAEKILTSKAALEGERKQVTVLFADLKGSMELLADRDPEEARKLLDPVLERMMEAVHHYEGTVNQVMGDGIMALFGAPVAHEDHAVRACYAALRMQEGVSRYGSEAQRAGAIPVQIRVGLNSGEVVVRSIGSDLHMDYTAVGQTAHLAGRMEQLAVPGTILITADTLRLAEGLIQATSLGAAPVKGLTQPIELFELIGATPTRRRFEAAAARGLTRFVGRQAELEALNHALERTFAGHGEVLALVGEPGVGKSRIIWEFTHSRWSRSWLLLESGALSFGKATAYRPVIDLLKTYFHLEDRDDWRRIREKVTGKLLALDETLKPILPAFLALLDVPVEDPEWRALDDAQRRQRILEGCKRLLLRESQVQPVLLVFEDLHWIDTETQAFLDSLVESLSTARLLLVVNYRPEYEQRWVNETCYTQLRIDPLPLQSVEELLQVLLGDDPSLRPVRQLLIARTEGNPFFLEESVRTVVETGVLAGERGAYRLATTPAGIQVPTTVQAVLAARIDRLLPEEKRLLQSAAVIGKDVPFNLLQAIAEVSEEALRRSITHLQAGEFLYETSVVPELEFTFKHALTHDVAYGSLLHERRRILHARIVDAIDHLYQGRLAEHVEQLAHHALRAEMWEKAVLYLREAGAKAATRSAHKQAVMWFEQALGALTRLPESHEKLERAIDLRFDLRNSLVPLGELERVLAFLREAEGFAKTLDDPRRLGWLSIYMSGHLWQIGYSKDAGAFARRAQVIAEKLEDFALRVAANFYLGQASFVLGDYRGAEEVLRRNVAPLQGAQSRELFGLAGFPSVLSASYLAWTLAEQGAFAEGIVHAKEAVRIAEAVEHRYSLILACWRLASIYSVKGDFSDATPLLERALDLSRESNIALLSPYVTGSLGYVYAWSGRVAEGLPLLEQARSAGESMGSLAFHTLIVIHLGETCLLAAQVADALALARRALRLACERAERGHEAWASRLLGEIASHHDPSEVATAEAHYGAALALASELGMRPLLAHCRLGLGKLYRRSGKWEQAQEHLMTATTMYREMDMRFWLEQAEREIQALT